MFHLFHFTDVKSIDNNKSKQIVSLIEYYSVGKMEHEKSLRGQSKFSNTDALSVGKIKIKISNKK